MEEPKKKPAGKTRGGGRRRMAEEEKATRFSVSLPARLSRKLDALVEQNPSLSKSGIVQDALDFWFASGGKAEAAVEEGASDTFVEDEVQRYQTQRELCGYL